MKTILKIDGMECDNCVKHVTEALKGVAGVTAAVVSLEEERAEVEHSEAASLEAMKAAVVDAGYEVVA